MCRGRVGRDVIMGGRFFIDRSCPPASRVPTTSHRPVQARGDPRRIVGLGCRIVCNGGMGGHRWGWVLRRREGHGGLRAVDSARLE